MEQTQTVATAYLLRLKGDLLSKSKKDTNRHQVSLDARISATTAYNLLSENAKNISRLDLDNFVAIMIDGLGYSPEELLTLPLGEIFAIYGHGAE
jgi:hypothetical protein